MALRIIAGKHRGRRIDAPETKDTRPTAGRTREAVFNILMHADFGSDEHALIDQPVADIFCGSGAMGLEALSRGARHCIFVDKGREAIDAVEENLERIGETDNARVIRADSSQLPHTSSPVRLLFVDPPYESGLAKPALQSALSGGWLDELSVVVLEQSKREELDIPDELHVTDERIYGNSRVTILRVK